MNMEILQYPDQFLRGKTPKLRNFDSRELREFALSLYREMLEKDGLGLAGRQVGNDFKLFAIHTKFGLGAWVVNPKWRAAAGSKKILMDEACLSFPNLQMKIPRYNNIRVEFQDIYGATQKGQLTGLASQVFQHETDHLKGVLMVDYLRESSIGVD